MTIYTKKDKSFGEKMAFFLLALITLGHIKYNLYTHIGQYYVIMLYHRIVI